MERLRGEISHRLLTSLKMNRSSIPATLQVVNIELTNHCNQKCVFCPTGLNSNGRPKGKLDLQTFKKITERIARSSALILAGFGEPFLNENLETFVNHAHEIGLSRRLEIYSNFGAISNERIRGLLDLPFKTLIISLDSLNRETFRSHKGCDQFDQVYKNIRLLSDEVKKRGCLGHELIVQMIVTRKNVHEAQDFIDAVKALKLVPRLKQLNTHMPRLTQDKIAEFEVQDYSRYDRNGYSRKCEWVWGGLQVFWNGDVTVCCQDPTGLSTYGSIHDMNATDLLNVAAGRCEFRRNYFEDPGQIDICRNCDRA
jgi:sulfatase maturation enzyme AslB (radical SAM superfamily)